MAAAPALLARCLAAGLLLSPLRANDGAAEVAAGGIQLRQEGRVAMTSERLLISQEKVQVDYVFTNDTDQDVTTAILFPLPAYKYQGVCCPGYDRKVEAFQAWVDGEKIPITTEVRAKLGDRDVTAVLASLHLDIAYFGNYLAEENGLKARDQIAALTPPQRTRLRDEGLLDKEDDRPLWQVEILHHWTQRFPARRSVRITHSYVPVVGDTNTVDLDTLERPGAAAEVFPAPGCPDPALKALLRRRVDALRAKDPAGYHGLMGAWVSYILTTANTWKGPIRDFELTVQRRPGELVTFCWDGKVEKVGPDTFRARATDFRPSKELTVYFLQVY